MRAVIIISVIVLAGCAANGRYANVNQQHLAECEYQAEVATPGSNNLIADAMRRRDLTDMCLRVKGYR